MFSTTATKEALQAFYHCATHPIPFKAAPAPRVPGNFMDFLPFMLAFIMIGFFFISDWHLSSSKRNYALKHEVAVLKKEKKDLREKLNALQKEKKAEAEARVDEEREKEADAEYEVLVDGKGA